MTLAFVFPGQGAQAVGMLDAFADSAPVQQVLTEADAALGESLSGLIAQGPAETLALTVNTQPASRPALARSDQTTTRRARRPPR